MARFTAENTLLAKEIIGRYPLPKSALIPLLHLAQSQDGHVTDDAMEHIAELVDATPAEVVGTCSFYEMFKREKVGDYLINVCTNISCLLNGGEELLGHVEDRLDIRPGSTTADGVFTLEDVECIAACTEAPCLQVNYRYFHRVSHDAVDTLIDDLRQGRRAHDIPKHGTLSRVRQHIPPDRRAGAALPTDATEPRWLRAEPGEPAEPEPSPTGSAPTDDPVPAAIEDQSPEPAPDEAPADAHAAEANAVATADQDAPTPSSEPQQAPADQSDPDEADA